MSLERAGFTIIEHAEVEQDTHKEPNLTGRVPQVRPFSSGSDSSGFSSSSSSSYYTASTSFGTSFSSSLYFTPNASFEEEKQGEDFLKDGSTRHILSVENPENIARKQQIKIEQTTERELEALLRERDLAYNPEEQGFNMDVDNEPEPCGDDDDTRVTSIRDSGPVTDVWRDKDSAEAADTVTSLVGPSKTRTLVVMTKDIIDPADVYRTVSDPLNMGN